MLAGLKRVQPDTSTTEIGNFRDCLTSQMPRLRHLTLRLEVTLFRGVLYPTGSELRELDRNEVFMLWLSATCVERHSRLKFASWTERARTV